MAGVLSDAASAPPTAMKGSVVVLELGSGEKIANPTDAQIRAALEELDVQRDGEGFAILARSPMTYVQVSGDAARGFDLEYQVDSVREHYRARRTDYALDEVVAVLAAYRDGAERWDEVGEFERITW